jgi:hypothetical protein
MGSFQYRSEHLLHICMLVSRYIEGTSTDVRRVVVEMEDVENEFHPGPISQCWSNYDHVDFD